jgi:hypothetical protein
MRGGVAPVAVQELSVEEQLAWYRQSEQDFYDVVRNIFAGPQEQKHTVLSLGTPPVARAPAETHAQDVAQGCTALRELIADYGASVVWQDVVMAVFREYSDVVHRLTGWRP